MSSANSTSHEDDPANRFIRERRQSVNPLQEQISTRTSHSAHMARGSRQNQVSMSRNSGSFSNVNSNSGASETPNYESKSTVLPSISTDSTEKNDGQMRETEGHSVDGAPTLQTTSSGRTLVSPPDEFHLKKSKSSGHKHFLSKVFGSQHRDRSHREDDAQDVELSRNRDEGCSARVFDCIGSIPTQPKYIWVRAHRKRHREFNHLFLAQELNVVSGRAEVTSKAAIQNGETKSTTWCARFSLDGKYMATAGADNIVRVWQVLKTPEEREAANIDITGEFEEGSGFRRRGPGKPRSSRTSAPVFVPYPIREYHGHTGDVLDLSWSKNNFLLSSSMDKTVRLWHLDIPESIGQFRHTDFVTSIAFHPKDDRFFLSGSLDCKLRLWSITEKEIAFTARAPDLIMNVAFTPDGTTAISGCFGGQCIFYKTEGLILTNQMIVKSSRGKNSNGSKITGIEAKNMPSKYLKHPDESQNVKLLISTNDSRIRMYDFETNFMEAKYKGHENAQGLIRASFSDDGTYIVSGSEDDRTYIWKVDSEADESSRTREDYEYFHSNNSVVTVALFVPNETKNLLYESRDPILDIANALPGSISRRSSANSLRREFTPENASTSSLNRSSPQHPDLTSTTSSASSSRVIPPDSNIIITFDQEGHIKVFRQDSAYEIRKQKVDKRSSAFLVPTASNMLPVMSLRGRSPSSSRVRSPSNPRVRSPTQSPARAPTSHSQRPVNADSAAHTQVSSPLHNEAQSARKGSMPGSPVSSSFDTHDTKADASWHKRSSSPSSSFNLEPQPRGTVTPIHVASPRVKHATIADDEDPNEIKCKNCGSNDFRARTSDKGVMVLLCKKYVFSFFLIYSY